MAGIRPDGALAGDADLVITLAPDLDGNDPFVRFLVGMRNVKGLKVQAPPSLVRRLGSPRGLCTWTVSGDGQGHFVATWTEGTRTRVSGLRHAGNFSPADVERLYGPRLDPADDVIDHWQTFQAHMAGGNAGRIFVTSRERLIESRWAEGMPGSHGQVTPTEAMHIASLVARTRGEYVIDVDAESASRNGLDPFSWASTAAQALMPAYLPYHKHIVDECERVAAISPALDYVEGVFKWVRLLVEALNRLALAHLREAAVGSDNWTMLQQSDDVAAALQACAGSLEALAGLIAQRAGTALTDKDRRSVSFPSLVSQNKPWSRNLGRFEGARVCAAKAADGPIALASAMREEGFHHHPLSIRNAVFGHTLEVVDSAGNTVPRLIEDVTMGAVQPTGEPVDPAWATHGEDGILLQGDEPPYLLPWPHIRAVARELTTRLDATLAEMARIEGVAIPTTAGAKRMFFTMPVDDAILRASIGI